jgi:hypothetical protein
MLDIARAVVLVLAIVQAIRHRFVVGIVFGIVLSAGFAVVVVASYVALANHTVSGEYGFAFVYIGPTALPFGQRDWLPVVVQCALAATSGVPALTALRTPSSPFATPFLGVFVASAMLAVLTTLGAFLLWHQKPGFPEYWQNR